MISVFGATGFIGNRFCEIYPNETEKISRNSRTCSTNDILYLISTVDNYNIFSDPYVDIDTNLKILVEVLENCRINNKQDTVFNFVSSWFVYGKNTSLPAKETSHCNPNGFYSITKRAAEQILISYCETHNMKYRIFRLSNVYGNGDKKTSKKKNALQHMITEVINNRNINLYEGGTHIRDYMHIDDACHAIKLCMDKAKVNDIINIGTGKGTTIFEAMSYVREKTNSSSEFIAIKTPEFHKVVQVENMFLDITKINKLNFKPKYDIKKGLDKLLEDYTQ